MKGSPGLARAAGIWVEPKPDAVPGDAQRVVGSGAGGKEEVAASTSGLALRGPAACETVVSRNFALCPAAAPDPRGFGMSGNGYRAT